MWKQISDYKFIINDKQILVMFQAQSFFQNLLCFEQILREKILLRSHQKYIHKYIILFFIHSLIYLYGCLSCHLLVNFLPVEEIWKACQKENYQSHTECNVLSLVFYVLLFCFDYSCVGCLSFVMLRGSQSTLHPVVSSFLCLSVFFN